MNYRTKGSANEFSRILRPMRIDTKLCEEYMNRYLKDIYRGLTESNGESYITEYILGKYLNLPLFLTQRVFGVFKNSDGYWDFSDLYFYFKVLNVGCYDKITKFIFDILDFNKDGLIYMHDCRILLIHLALFSNEDKFSQEKIFSKSEELIKLTFPKTHMNIKDFRLCLEKRNSDVFFSIIFFLLFKLPFNEEILKYYEHDKRIIKSNRNVKWTERIKVVRYSETIKFYIGYENYNRLTNSDINFSVKTIDEDEVELDKMDDIEISEIYEFNNVSSFKNPHFNQLRKSNTKLICIPRGKSLSSNTDGISVLLRSTTHFDRVRII
jgi:hypothetical protein